MGHTLEKTLCGSEEQGCSKFNIIQKISVRIPLKFKAECDVSQGVAIFDLHNCKNQKALA